MIRLRSFCLLAFLLIAPAADAGFFTLSGYHPYGPIATRSQNPLSLLFLFDSLERPETAAKGQISASVETSFSNLFERRLRAAGIGIDLDMELVRTALNLGYGITDSYEAGFQLPFLSFSGGFLDAFIQDYHNAFGFPNAGRDRVPNGRFSYQVTNDGAAIYSVNRSDLGLSDLILWQKLKILEETKTLPAVGVKGSLKLPTGSRTAGTGSGKPDFSLSLFAEKSYKRLHSYTQAGFSALGGHENLDPILVNGAFVFGQAIELNVTEHVSWITQLWGASPIFKGTGIPELSKPTLDITLGAAGEVPLKSFLNPPCCCYCGCGFASKTPPKFRYQVGFTEDITSVGPSVDFTMYFNVGMDY